MDPANAILEYVGDAVVTSIIFIRSYNCCYQNGIYGKHYIKGCHSNQHRHKGGTFSIIIPGVGEITDLSGVTVGVAGVVHGGAVVLSTAIENLLKFEPIENQNEETQNDNSEIDDDLVSPNEAGKELKKNSDADKVAQKAGYKDAHDFKKATKLGGQESDWNMMYNEKTKEIFLRRLSDNKIVRTYESTN